MLRLKTSRRSAWPRRRGCSGAIARGCTPCCARATWSPSRLPTRTGTGTGRDPVRIERSSLERWLVAGGAAGRPLSPRNAWALIGLASGDQPFSERALGLLEHPEEVSRTRARLERENLIKLAPRL